MKCRICTHLPVMLPVDVPIVERVDFVKKYEGNIGVSSKKVLIFKENSLSLIDRYQVFVDTCKK